MKIVNSNVEILEPNYEENIQRHIEKIARICYKSEDKITKDSHKKMITNLYKRKHWAMLEHFIFIVEINEPSIFHILKHANLKYFNFTDHFDTKKEKSCYLVSCSARGILDALINDYNKYNHKVLEYIAAIKRQLIFHYNCYELFGSNIGEDNICIRVIDDISEYDTKNQLVHGWYSVKFICDRGVSHELVRHRDASFAQESTRYCNYSQDKFNNEITVIKPFMLKDGYENPNEEMVAYTNWKIAMETAETSYFNMLKAEVSPQIARSVLPNSLKTEIVMTAHNYEWKHVLGLRCDKTAHPQMREVAFKLFKLLNEHNDNVFNKHVIEFEN